MGATNEIKGTNLSLQLEGKECPQCQQKFTQKEITERNFELWFDTTNDVKLVKMGELEKEKSKDIPLEYFKYLYYPFGKTGYQLTIWIRSIEHEYCPETELCNRCYKRLLIENMEKHDGYLHCSPCYQQITDKNKEI